MNILAHNPTKCLNFMVAPQKKNFGQNFFLGGWGKEILGCFIGKSLYAQFHVTRQTTVNKFPASITNYMDLLLIVDWEPLGMDCCGHV